jgi:hypothetical protein
LLESLFDDQAGLLDGMVVCMPPQHGKSELIGDGLPDGIASLVQLPAQWPGRDRVYHRLTGSRHPSDHAAHGLHLKDATPDLSP